MRALWIENGLLRLRDDVARPAPAGGEALVRVRLAGICNTDLELVKGYMPFRGVPGHEFVGTVESAPGYEEWVSRRVVGEINAVCGSCEMCLRGWPRHCEQRTVLGIAERDGAFAEFLCLPVANLHSVPDAVGDDVATFVEPLAAALEVQEQVPIRSGAQVVVIGDGKLGQLVAAALVVAGVRLTLVGREARQRPLLAPHGIASVPSSALAERRADVVVECTGNPEGLALALRLVRPRGTVVMKSTYATVTELNASVIIVDEITLVGSRCGPFAAALDLLATGKIDPLPLVTARYPLEQGVEAFAQAARPGVGKVLLAP